MKPAFKDYIDRIVPYEPGRPIEDVARELGLKRIVKMASNENPLGPSPKALRAMQKAVKQVHLYPDGGASELKRVLAKAFGLPATQFIVGNGSNEIIELLARGFVSEGDRVISSKTSFLVYPLISQAIGAEYVEVPMRNFRYDLQGLLKQVNDRTRLVFIANPNNPTGSYVTKNEVEHFLQKLPDHVVACFDEAYVDFSTARDFPKTVDYVCEKTSNVVVLRTFSKSCGLAGLRVGYGVASAETVRYLEKIRQPFNVNRIAQAAAVAALHDRPFLNRTKGLVIQGKQYLYDQFKQMKLEFVLSEANFVLVNIERDGRKVFEALLNRGIIVRPMTAYGLPTYLRVTIGKRADLERFIRALKDEIKK